MKIECLHGYFKFSEVRQGQVSDFMNVYGVTLVRERDYYTFPFLKDAPDYSLPGSTYLGSPSTELFEGEPWEIMEQNELVFNFNTNLVVPISTITNVCPLDLGLNYFLSPGLILPGSVTADGNRVKEYSAWFLKESMRFKYSEVGFV